MTSAQPYRALRNPNYRLFFAGQLISLTGTWMQGVVQAWLIYRLTHSAQWLGLITFANQVPAFLLSPFAGVFADRKDRRKLLLWVVVIQMLQAFALSALVFTGKIAPWHLIALSAVLGVANAFEITTRHAFAYDLVGKEDLPSAISLNAIVVNGSRVAGPALGGVMLGALGEGGCFFVGGLSYLAVIYGLVVMRLKPRSKALPSTAPILEQLSEAFRYVARAPRVRKLLALAAFVSFMAFPYGVLLPVIAKSVLQGGPETLAWLTSMGGVGAVFGVIGMNWGSRGARAAKAGIGNYLLFQTLMTGTGLVLLGLSSTLVLSFGATFMIGYFLMTLFPLINALIQQEVADSLRGRVLSFYTMTFLGAVPLGSLIQGLLTDKLGAPAVAMGAGGLCALAAGGALLLRHLHCFSRPKPLKTET